MEANAQVKEARAILRYARISPRKVKIVLDLIRNQDTDKAKAILKNIPNSAAEYLLKLLNSAIANADRLEMDTKNLYVAECHVGPGPTLKRLMTRARGSADRILKRTSHMTIILREKA